MKLIFRLIASLFSFQHLRRPCRRSIPRAIAQTTDAMNTLQGSFVQTLFDKDGKKQDEQKGVFVMLAPR